MFQIIMKIIGLLLVLTGVILIYDARILTKKFFGFGDQNEGSNGLKILGFLVLIIGEFIIYFSYVRRLNKSDLKVLDMYEVQYKPIKYKYNKKLTVLSYYDKVSHIY